MRIRHSSLLLTLGLFLISSIAGAVQRVHLEDAASLIKNGNHERAIVLIEAERESRDLSGLELFMLGTAYNRTGRFDLAIQSFQDALSNGFYTNSLDLEKGFALVNAGQFSEAEVVLNIYLLHFPEDTVATALLQEAQSPTQAAGVGAKSVQADDSFRFWVSSDLGYNSNPLAISDGQLLPEDFGSKDDAYLGVYLGADYRQRPTEKTGWALSYNLSARFYDEFSDFNSQWHQFRAGHRSRLSKRSGLTLSAGWNTYLLDSDRLRDQGVLGAELTTRWNYQNRTSVFLRQNFNDFRFTALLDRLDRSGTRTDAGLQHSYLVGKTRLEGGLTASQNRSDGDDFEFDAFGVSLGMTHWLPRGDLTWLSGSPVLKLNASFVQRDFDNPSVFSPSSKRDDDFSSVSATLQLPLMNAVSVFMTCTWRDQDSNVGIFDWDQNHCSVGGTYLF